MKDLSPTFKPQFKPFSVKKYFLIYAVALLLYYSTIKLYWYLGSGWMLKLALG